MGNHPAALVSFPPFAVFLKVSCCPPFE